MMSRKQAEKTTAGQTQAISYPKGRRTQKSALKAQRWEPKPQAAVLSPELGTSSIICPRGFSMENLLWRNSHMCPRFPLWEEEGLWLLLYTCPSTACWVNGEIPCLSCSQVFRLRRMKPTELSLLTELDRRQHIHNWPSSEQDLSFQLML